MHDRIGLVTAAASGMGRAGALRLAREGAAVGVVDVDAEGAAAVAAEISAAGGRARALAGDLTDEAFSREIVARAVDAFGGLDFVWCHAGHPGPAKVEDMDLGLFDLAVDLNLRSMAITTSAAIPEIRKRAGGSLLYTASTGGLRGSPRSPTYSAMKFGVVGWARSLAKRLAPEGIRVNVICPGGVDTPMLRQFLARPDQESTAGADPESLVAGRNTAYPMGRPARPDEIASAALFLLSSEASYVSGATLAVDGAMIA